MRFESVWLPVPLPVCHRALTHPARESRPIDRPFGSSIVRAALYFVIRARLPAAARLRPSDAVWVTLDLQKGGKPYVAPENQSVQVTFYGIERKTPVPGQEFGHEPFAARLTGEATYEVPGPEGYGIPAGKYRISVIRKPKTGTLRPGEAKGRRPPNAPNRDEDFLKNQFGPESSPIIRTVDRSMSLDHRHGPAFGIETVKSRASGLASEREFESP